METIFISLINLAFIAAIVGLFRPSLVRMKTRKQAFWTYFGVTVVIAAIGQPFMKPTLPGPVEAAQPTPKPPTSVPSASAPKPKQPSRAELEADREKARAIQESLEGLHQVGLSMNRSNLTACGDAMRTNQAQARDLEAQAGKLHNPLMFIPRTKSRIQAILWLIAFSGYAEELRLEGSATFHHALLASHTARFEAESGVRLLVRVSSSGEGFHSLHDGLVEAALSSAPLSLLVADLPTGEKERFQESVIGVDTVVPIVHVNNPLSRLSKEVWSDLYSGRVRGWEEMAWTESGEEVLAIVAQPQSGTRMVFSHEIMGESDFSPWTLSVKSPSTVAELVSRTPNAIGVASRCLLAGYETRVRVVEAPPLLRPLSIITRGEPSPAVQRLISFLKDAEAHRQPERAP